LGVGRKCGSVGSWKRRRGCYLTSSKFGREFATPHMDFEVAENRYGNWSIPDFQDRL
jgi:hypothetical protein